MDLIKILEEKFLKIENKLKSLQTKTQLINNNYKKDHDAIQKLFDPSKQKKFENGLKECRDGLIKQFILDQYKKTGEIRYIKSIIPI